MPALVNMRVGSFLTTIGADGTIVCPFDLKNSKKLFRISLDVMFMYVFLCFGMFFGTVRNVLSELTAKIRFLNEKRLTLHELL